MSWRRKEKKTNCYNTFGKVYKHQQRAHTHTHLLRNVKCIKIKNACSRIIEKPPFAIVVSARCVAQGCCNLSVAETCLYVRHILQRNSWIAVQNFFFWHFGVKTLSQKPQYGHGHTHTPLGTHVSTFLANNSICFSLCAHITVHSHFLFRYDVRASFGMNSIIHQMKSINIIRSFMCVC